MVVATHSLPDRRRIDLKLTLIFSLFLGVGLMFSALNIHLPIARNALDYAKAASELVKRHYDVYGVVRDQAWTGGKPILFSIIAAPFVSMFNANIGTVIASALGTTLFFVTALLTLTRLNKRHTLSKDGLPLQFTLTVFNPLVLYQFWSGYPDALFAGLILLSFYLIDIISTEPERDSRPHIVGLCITICIAMYTKFYGAVLSLMCLAYLLVDRRENGARFSYSFSKVVLLIMSFGIPGMVLITAKLGINPLLIFGSNSGFGDYIDGLSGASVQDAARTLAMLLFSIFLAFHITLPPAFISFGPWARWRAPTLFLGIYILGLLPATGASYNMRYFLAAFPFVASLIAVALRAVSKNARQVILITYVMVASILVLNFNIPTVQVAFRPIVSKLYVWQPRVALWLDNLRLPVQLSLKEQIDAVNTTVPAGSTLYWSSDYSGPATHGLSHDLGVKDDIDVRYVLESSDPPPSSRPVYLTRFTSAEPPETLWRAPDWSTAQSQGHGLFRLDPVSIQLASVGGDYVIRSEEIRIEARVNSGLAFTNSSLQFSDGRKVLATDPTQPSVLQLRYPTPGRHEIRAKLSYGVGDTAVSEPLVIYVGIPAFERVANSISDVITEIRGGSIWATEDSLWMDESERFVGIRFEHIGVGRGTHLARAYLRLTTATIASKPTVLEIHAELSGNAHGLRFTDNDLSSRSRTAAHVAWSLGTWTAVGQDVISPNLASLLNEVFSQMNWNAGNALMLLIRVSGHERLVGAANDNGHGAPALYLELQ